MQCSIHPPRFAIGISKKNRTFRVLQGAEIVVVHLVTEDDVALAELFGGETGDHIDKFERCEWHQGPSGVPILTRCKNWFAARIREHIDPGDHVLLLLEPFEGKSSESTTPLRFQRARSIAPGHEP